MRKKIGFAVIIIFLLSFKIYAASTVCGKTYPIVEPDLLAEAQKAAKHINLQQMQKKIKHQTLLFKPSYSQYIPPAKDSYIYTHDVIYTLPFDIPKVVNGKVVGVLYPKGFTYHVLRYIPYMQTLVIFDMKNPLEKKWVIKHYGKDFKVKLITVSGNLKELLELVKQLKRPVFFNLKQINERFNLQHTISIVSRSEKNRDDVIVKVIGLKQIADEFKKDAKKNQNDNSSVNISPNN